MEEERDAVADGGEGCILQLGVRASLWARRQVSRSSPHSALPPLPTIRLSVSITVGWLTVLDKSSLFQTSSGALSAGDRTLSPDEKTGPGKLN